MALPKFNTVKTENVIQATTESGDWKLTFEYRVSNGGLTSLNVNGRIPNAAGVTGPEKTIQYNISLFNNGATVSFANGDEDFEVAAVIKTLINQIKSDNSSAVPQA